MTVTTTLPAPTRLAGPDDRAGLGQAVRAEWTKLVSLRSTRWALLITLAVCALGTFLSTNGDAHQGHGFYRNFDPTNAALGGLAFSSLVVAVLAVLCMTGEYSSGTIRSSLAATPRRSVFYGAKVLVFGLFSVVLGFALCALSFFEGQAVLRAGGAPTASIGDPGVLHVLVLSSLFFALLSLFGFGIGAVIRHTAGAIATFYGATLLTALILQSVPGHPARYTPVQIFGNSVAAVVRIPDALSSSAGFLLMTLYTVVVLVAGGVLLALRDA